MNWPFILITFLLSFFSTFLLLPYTKKWIEQKKILKEDTNKFKRPRVKSLEGMICVVLFIVIVSFVLGLQTLLNMANLKLSLFLPGLLSVVVIALVSFIDDILNIPSKFLKIVLISPALIPVISINFSSTTIIIPFFGPYQLSIFYPFLIIPLVIIVTTLAINLSKKHNKLTLNNCLTISGTLFICAWLKEDLTAMIIFACLLGLFLVLRNYREIQQKISLGRVGRFSFGAVFAIGAIIGNIKLALAILLIPYLVYFLIKKSCKFVLSSNVGFPLRSLNFFGKKLTAERIINYISVLEIVCALIAVTIQIQRADFF